MDDAHRTRIGELLGQIAGLITSDAPVKERLSAYITIVAGVRSEVDTIERDASNDSSDLTFAKAWMQGFIEGRDAGEARGRREAHAEAERAITGEPVTMAEVGVADAGSDGAPSQFGEAKPTVH